ncbi:hypothetical protein TNCV_4599351 [Trichonephila clavipes]|nr:hypothetical protein TNCV_4599351 [Trichonephila clavipes]
MTILISSSQERGNDLGRAQLILALKRSCTCIYRKFMANDRNVKAFSDFVNSSDPRVENGSPFFPIVTKWMFLQRWRRIGEKLMHDRVTCCKKIHAEAKVEEKQFETLNKETATHIGIREAEDWFRPIDLAKECDIYISSKNGSHKEIPITYGYTQDPFKNRSQNFKTKIKENYPQYLERENKNCSICGDSSHYARDCAYAYPNVVSVSNVIKNSSYDLPHVKNFNTRNDLSSLIKDYKSLAVEAKEKRNRFEQTSRTLERKISMRSTKDQLVKKNVLMPVKHNVFLWNLPDVEEMPSHDGETV